MCLNEVIEHMKAGLSAESKSKFQKVDRVKDYDQF